MASPRQLPSLTDDLLEEIFLRIACPADLARASAACVAFRRLITDRIFLRRYRSRHPPLLLGFLNIYVREGFHAVAAPHPNAPAARALANVSFDYLPPPSLKDWYISDVRDGLVLFNCSEQVYWSVVVKDLAVCDPPSLSRRYRLLPPVPGDQEGQDLIDFDAAFAPCAQEDDGKFFRVIITMYYYTKLVVVVFDSASGSWTIGTSASWDPLSLCDEPIGCPWAFLMDQCYAYGCFYWKIDGQNKLLKLDLNRMEFSTVDLPPDHEKHDVVVVEAGEDMLGMFSYNRDKFLNYYNSTMQNEVRRTNEWQMKNVIPLPVFYDSRIAGAFQGYLFIQDDTKVQDSKHTTVYSFDIKTLKLEVVTLMNCHFRGLPYFGFPPSIISPGRI